MVTPDKLENKRKIKGDKRGLHPNSLKNLENGRNHNGRPKKDKCLLEYIRAQLGEQCQYEPGKTWLEALAHAELRHSLKDTAARRDLFDRLLGKPLESLELAGKGGQPLPQPTFVIQLPDGTRVK